METRVYSQKIGLSDVEKTIKSAVNDFTNLSSKIDKLYVFVFDSKEIQQGTDIEKMLFHSGLEFRSKRPIWSLIYSNCNKKIGLIEVNAEEFLDSSSTRRKFVARHELGHIFLSGPSNIVTLENVPINASLEPIIKKHLNWILEMWKEFKVNSLMMKLFPELTIQYMYENPKGFSKLKDQTELRRCQTPFESLLVSIKLEITCEMELLVLNKAPSSLKRKHWKSIRRLHQERMEFLKSQALLIRPELRDIHKWFTEEYLENKELLVRRVLELSSPS